MRTTEAAQGKWRGILTSIGIDESFLRNVHGPCPLCGGNDRFRYDDKDGNGTYYCNSCGAGDGMKLAQSFTGQEFKEIAKRIDALVGNIKTDVKPIRQQDPSKRIKMILAGCKPLSADDCATLYLKGRGLPKPSVLGFNPEVAYYEDGKFAGNYPAMIGKITNQEGQLVTLHITYLTKDGKKAPVKSPKKVMTPLSDLSGCSVRLTQIYAHIGVTEGIETACAVMKLHKVPTWASCNADMMEKFIPPKGVESVTVYADNDLNYRGQAAAYRLANRLIAQYGIKASVEVPTITGDYADLLINTK